EGRAIEQHDRVRRHRCRCDDRRHGDDARHRLPHLCLFGRDLARWRLRYGGKREQRQEGYRQQRRLQQSCHGPRGGMRNTGISSTTTTPVSNTAPLSKLLPTIRTVHVPVLLKFTGTFRGCAARSSVQMPRVATLSTGVMATVRFTYSISAPAARVQLLLPRVCTTSVRQPVPTSVSGRSMSLPNPSSITSPGSVCHPQSGPVPDWQPARATSAADAMNLNRVFIPAPPPA